MKKTLIYFLILSFLLPSFSLMLTGHVSAEINPDYQMNLKMPEGTIEEDPTTYDTVGISSAAVAACSSGIGSFVTDMISKISSALKCLMFGSFLGTDAGTKCTVSAGGTDTVLKCQEWIQKKLSSWKKFKAQILKLLIATAARRLLDNMTMDVVDWISGKTTGEPQFVSNFGDYILNSIKEATGDTIENSGMLNFLCSPFKAEVVMDLSVPGNRMPLPYCTLNTVISNIEDFYDNFTSGGWIAFNEIVKPQNNPLGAWIMQTEYLQEQAATIAYEQEQQIKSGFIPTKACRVLETDPDTGNDRCLEYAISIPGQTKSDMTSKVTTTQFDNVDKYMITEKDLAGYAQLILDAIVSRVVTSAKQNVFGGKNYGEGLLNLPEQGEEDPDTRYSCMKAGDFSTCIPDKKGEFATKEECSAECTIKYRCDSELFMCIADDAKGTYPNEESCKTDCVVKYSCVNDACVPSTTGTYITEAECDKKCGFDNSDWAYPSCDACKVGVYVRGRGVPNSDNTKGVCSSVDNADCNLCSAVTSGDAGGGGGLLCQSFCEATREEAWGGKTGISSKTFTKKEIEDSGYDLIWRVGGGSVPSSCTCDYSDNYKKLNEFSFGSGYTRDDSYCYNCTKLPQTAKDLSYWGPEAAEPRWVCDDSTWCDKYCCNGCPTPPPLETLQ
jgi:hypothetical protein